VKKSQKLSRGKTFQGKTFQGKTFQGKTFQGKNFPGETFQGKREMLSPKSCAGVDEYDANSFPGPP
jgi:hypothetical protein